MNADGDWAQTVRNAADVVRILRGEGVGRGLWQHFDWSKKNCPQDLREGRDGTSWSEFLALVAGGGVVLPTPVPPKPQPGARLDEDGKWGKNLTTRLQEVFGTPRDGVVSRQNLAWKKANPG